MYGALIRMIPREWLEKMCIRDSYKTFIENNVDCLSEPQYFDFRADGFGESRACYFRDPDGIILEMMQPL